MGDAFIVGKIHEAYAIWENVNETPTPRDSHPPTTLTAEVEARRVTEKVRAHVYQTAPYSLIMSETPEKVDLELDLLLQDMNISK